MRAAKASQWMPMETLLSWDHFGYFPTSRNRFQAKPPAFTNPDPADTLCGFVTELDPAGAHQLYSSYLCGSLDLTLHSP